MGITYQIPGQVPNDGDDTRLSGYWRERFTAEPYYAEGDNFEDFEPAYRAGYQARVRDIARAYDEVEGELQAQWEADRKAGKAKLEWERAKHAVRRAWDEATERGSNDKR